MIVPSIICVVCCQAALLGEWLVVWIWNTIWSIQTLHKLFSLCFKSFKWHNIFNYMISLELCLIFRILSIKWCQHRATRKHGTCDVIIFFVYPILLCSNLIVSCVYMYFILTCVNPLLSCVNFVLSLPFFFKQRCGYCTCLYGYVCLHLLHSKRNCLKNTKILNGCHVKMLVNISYTNDMRTWSKLYFSVYH